jgi:NADPH:quinone reductase-like Zn-dependent oxidoreductase
MATATSMKAIRIATFGGPEVVSEQTIAAPRPGASDLLVKNEAAGVNPVDAKIRAGKYPPVGPDKLPYILGRDVSGEVVECGPSVKRFANGDAVFAMPGIERGGYAEYVVVRESEAAARPRSLGSVAAGATPLAALTAWQGLFRYGAVEAGQRILIHGGSGGVGHFAVQFAKAKGAFVATTVSGRHVGFARDLGADQVIDYEKQNFEDEVENVDMVFDLIAGETQDRSWSVIKRGGVLVSTLAQPSQQEAARRGVRGIRYTAAESGADLGLIAELIDAGRVKPIVARVFALAAAAQAQQFLQKEHPAGKVVLTVG